MSQGPMEMLDKVTSEKSNNAKTIYENDLKIRQMKNVIADFKENGGITTDLIKMISIILEV